MTKKLFIVYTPHGIQFEVNPFIVLADNEQEAKQLVEDNEEYQETDNWCRRQNQTPPLPKKSWGLIRKHTLKPKKPYPVGISEVKEIPINDSKIVWKVLNVE
ncbi:MAG: hypothetical protein QM398_07095 [Thermoproteota archaeon]|nr:hypothetical protein [Thermoproteota archaeon]NLD66312.1 hypothetical protein [Thermoproteota archaeon]